MNLMNAYHSSLMNFSRAMLSTMDRSQLWFLIMVCLYNLLALSHKFWSSSQMNISTQGICTNSSKDTDTLGPLQLRHPKLLQLSTHVLMAMVCLDRCKPVPPL
jgi:hypothetical protein